MKLSIAAAAIAVALIGGTGAASARDTACAHVDLVFYTTDTGRLATELAAAASPCADYYVSITPTAAGAPRGGAPLTALRALGTHFHALAEIRLAAWAAYATTNGWVAAGVEARREMRAAGYDPSLGDTWAVNEVGTPSGMQMGIDVFNGVGTARQNLRDFVHGLDAGDDNVTDPGVVFAADPPQVTPDVSQYRAGLLAWYSDSAFWTDMRSYVRFWAEETFADVRAWGVAGSSLEQRTAYMNDYFLHGIRLAAGGDGRTETARAFLANAYLPLGNASYRWPAPDPTAGIGFGSTDVDTPTMEAFVGSQVHALDASSPSRFGFAFVPHSAAPSDAVAVDDRLAASIQSSGSCATGCDGSVASAAFVNTWKPFANTREGARATALIGPSVKVVFASVAARGATQAVAVPLKGAPPKGYTLVRSAYDVETTATHSGAVRICLAARKATVFRLGAHGWVALRTTVTPFYACGTTSVLGTFAAFAKTKRGG